MLHDHDRLSILSCFDPPDNLRGVCGLLCSYAADSGALEQMCMRFSESSPSQRRADGLFRLVLCTDGHVPQIADVAGLYHGLLGSQPPWRCMHAKIALLGFGPAACGPITTLRVVVSTANWTTSSLAGTIDLLWACDIDPKAPDAAIDLRRVLSFWQTLLQHYEIPPQVMERITPLLNIAVRTVRKPMVRFLDSINESKARSCPVGWDATSLGAQVLQALAEGSKGNLLICASGFLETADDQGEEPKILRTIDAELEARQALTKDHCRWLLVDPGHSAGLGVWARTVDLGEKRISLCRPHHPDLSMGSVPMHAKYVLIGKRHGYYLTSGRIYLGSGNLSHQGFAASPRSKGNVEAGVVFDLQRIKEEELCMLIGIDAKKDLTTDELDDALAQDEEPDDPLPLAYMAPPILALQIGSDESCRALWSSAVSQEENVSIHMAEETIEICPSQEYVQCVRPPVWPVSVRIMQGANSWDIPVFAPDGRLQRIPYPPLDMDEVEAFLAEFPSHSDAFEDDDTDDDLSRDSSRAELRDCSMRNRLALPLHQAMCMVDSIARRNQVLAPEQIPDWIQYLQDRLVDGLHRDHIAHIKKLDLDMLISLEQTPGFAPPNDPDNIWSHFVYNWRQHWGLLGSLPLMPKSESSHD